MYILKVVTVSAGAFYFNNVFHEFKVLKEVFTTKTFNVDFHDKFIKLWITLFFQLFLVYLSIYIYIYTHTNIYIYIYIYIYREREREMYISLTLLVLLI